MSSVWVLRNKAGRIRKVSTERLGASIFFVSPGDRLEQEELLSREHRMVIEYANRLYDSYAGLSNLSNERRVGNYEDFMDAVKTLREKEAA